VDRDGQIYRYVEETRMARHVVGYNDRSIGIEMVNTGRYPHWFHANHQDMMEPYTLEQIESLKELLADLKRRYPSLTQIARHSDLDTRTMPAEDDPSIQIRRRIDPGPLFPWDTIRTYFLFL
jgi:N-acetylmuramoyl-L-alanine amidase